MSMPSKPTRNKSINAEAILTETGEVSVGNSAREEEIRRRAYELYLERGQLESRELDDWLRAEREFERGVLSRAQAV
jgi:Protein of unknown function (DUF2934)